MFKYRTLSPGAAYIIGFLVATMVVGVATLLLSLSGVGCSAIYFLGETLFGRCTEISAVSSLGARGFVSAIFTMPITVAVISWYHRPHHLAWVSSAEMTAKIGSTKSIIYPAILISAIVLCYLFLPLQSDAGELNKVAFLYHPVIFFPFFGFTLFTLYFSVVVLWCSIKAMVS